MNDNKREISVFAKTDTCKTALEGRIVRAHNALAYCWLFRFLTVRPIFRLFIVNYLFLFYLNKNLFVLTDPLADCYKI